MIETPCLFYRSRFFGGSLRETPLRAVGRKMDVGKKLCILSFFIIRYNVCYKRSDCFFKYRLIFTVFFKKER
jgi:hypothetical protein